MFYALLVAGTLAVPTAAGAQQIISGGLPPYEIVTIVRSTGLDPIDFPVRRGALYVLHALDHRDRDVRVLIDARSGNIVSVTPVMTASRMPPGGVTMGPYERMPGPPPGYISREPPGVYRGGPPIVVDEDGPTVIYGSRPPAPVPGAPPPVVRATPQGGNAAPQRGNVASRIEPDDMLEPGRSGAGALPPPPERFPQRLPPAAEKPKPAKRAADVPKQAPLPKPRPLGAAPAPQPQPQHNDAVPPLAPDTPAGAEVPN
jgi:hypothetical protein